MKIDILGSQWTIEERSEKDDPRLDGCDGYTDWTKRQIIIEREIEGTLGDMEAYIRKVKRHEIVHAYAFECGLAECCAPVASWAENEEMIDWIARIGPKIYNTWVQAGAILQSHSKAEAEETPQTWFEKAYKEDADDAIKRLLEEVRSRTEHPDNDCPFCGEKARAMLSWKGAPVELQKMKPLPDINLTTGQKSQTAARPFMVLTIETEDGEDYFAIKHCPICGKYLSATER